MDEPANGLDTAGIIELRGLIKTLNKTSRMTAMISSQLPGEVEKMASHVGIIFKGKMLFPRLLSKLYSFNQKTATLFIKTVDSETIFQLLQE